MPTEECTSAANFNRQKINHLTISDHCRTSADAEIQHPQSSTRGSARIVFDRFPANDVRKFPPFKASEGCYAGETQSQPLNKVQFNPSQRDLERCLPRNEPRRAIQTRLPSSVPVKYLLQIGKSGIFMLFPQLSHRPTEPNPQIETRANLRSLAPAKSESELHAIFRICCRNALTRTNCRN
jgi:hypothetical protein